MGGFVAGFMAPLRAAGFLLAHRRLLLLSSLPFAISVALFAALFYFGIGFGDDLLKQYLPGGEEWYWQTIYWLAAVVSLLVFLVLEMLLFTVVGRVLAAPFLDVLTRKSEAVLSGRPAPELKLGILGEMFRVLRQEAAKLFIFGLVSLLLLLLNLLPGLGPLAYMLLTWLLAAFFLALEFLDYPLERRGLSLSGKIRYTAGLGSIWLGFGSALFVLLIVPLVNLALLPVAAVAGVMLYLRREGTRP